MAAAATAEPQYRTGNIGHLAVFSRVDPGSKPIRGENLNLKQIDRGTAISAGTIGESG